MNPLLRVLLASYAAIACTVLAACAPRYYGRVAYAIRFSRKNPKPCGHCGERHTHTKSEAAGFIAVETVRLLIGAIGWGVYFADAVLDKVEGINDED